ncbi:MAG: tryptophan--tRNA ligase, partial [Alphaproteobacteria bacterium]
SDFTRVNLTDNADLIAQKFRKARTDPDALPSEPKGLEERPEAANLVGIFAALSGRDLADVLSEYGGAQFSAFKPALAELAIDKLGPISAEMRRLMDNPDHIDAVLADGAQRERKIATPNMDAVKDIVGLLRTAG